MSGTFIFGKDAERESLDWGEMAWLSRPGTTGAGDLVMIEVVLKPGCGHDFHLHPEQEEVIYVVSGSIEQWLLEERRVLATGDSIFIAANTVHASFNVSDEPAMLLVALGPCVGDAGYEMVDVSDRAPWNALR
jgi:quercetin dioxygenase-like cupin family protein